jgi:hypothetical protein
LLKDMAECADCENGLSLSGQWDFLGEARGVLREETEVIGVALCSSNEVLHVEEEFSVRFFGTGL